MEPVFYHRPEGPAITLRSAPRLSSWNRVGDSGQARLTRALSYSQNAIDPQLAACEGAIALRFDVGLPRTARLLDERDLDNYLLPLTRELAGHTTHPIVSVWGGKRYAEATSLQIGTAQPRSDPGPEAATIDVTTVDVTATIDVTAAGDRDQFTSGFRDQVHDLLADQAVLPDGPVILEVAYVTGPGRDWLDLWWATIDGLGPLLGQSPAEPDGHPRDGRIADLGLHCTIDPQLGDDVRIGLRARPGWLDPVPADH